MRVTTNDYQLSIQVAGTTLGHDQLSVLEQVGDSSECASSSVF